MIDTDHAALLKAVARNTNDKVVQKCYADFLMERNNPGWLVVLNYPIQDWYVKDCEDVEWTWGRLPAGYWRLPWLEGRVRRGWISHHLTRIKYILTEYAEGRTV